MILTYPDLNCEVILGIKYGSEAYDSDDYPADCLKICTSQDKKGDFAGRVTQYLKEREVRKDSVYYICGNSGMVHEVSEYLEQKGITPENIRTEVFF
jgi:NAD(P)H-flavin reductase